MSCLGQCSTAVANTWKSQLKRTKICLSAHFQSLPSMVIWLHCFQVCGEEEHNGDRACWSRLLIRWQPEREEGEEEEELETSYTLQKLDPHLHSDLFSLNSPSSFQSLQHH